MKVRMFALSAGLHLAIVVCCVLLQLIIFPDADKRIGVAIALAMVAALGGLNGARFGRDGQSEYLTGAIFASTILTIVGLWLLWALTYPVGTPPPLRHYLATLFAKAPNAIWALSPTLAIVAAALIGTSVGRRLARTRTGGTVLRQRN